MGLLAAFVVCGKILMQELWRRGRDWDDPLELDVKGSWLTWFNQFVGLSKITIPRHVWAELEEIDMELHLFADALQRAMTAVAYLKCQRNNEVKVSLLMSKMQVAPLKKMSVPRLELQACLMAEFIVKQMEFKTIKVVFWSDSTVALSWIKMESCVLKEFVANRVEAIQEKTEGCQWHHISGQDNPADLALRGVDL
jgi:hypothetical protein